MAIAYVGIPGSGKSHDLVESVIIPALQRGETVYTNIPLNTGNLMRVHRIASENIAKLYQYPDVTDDKGKLQQPLSELMIPSEDPTANVLQNCHLVFDEVQGSLPFDAGRRNEETHRCRRYIEHHRHYNVELHWASQSEHLVDVSLRRLTDTVYLYKNLKHTAAGKFSRYGRIRRRLYMMSDGEVDAEMLEESVIDVNPKIFVCYKSFVGMGVAGQLKAPMSPALKRGLQVLGVIMFVVLPWSGYKTFQWYQKLSNSDRPKTVKETLTESVLKTESVKTETVQLVGTTRSKQYDAYIFDNRDGSFVLWSEGIPVHRCRNPLFEGIGNEVCEDVTVQRVADPRLLDGPPAAGGPTNSMPGMGAF